MRRLTLEEPTVTAVVPVLLVDPDRAVASEAVISSSVNYIYRLRTYGSKLTSVTCGRIASPCS